jgi:hypothetical protein
VDRTIPTVIVIVVLLGVFALMALSWRRRSRRDAALDAGYDAPVDPGRELASVPALYVATTPRDAPLERLAIRGLGFRSRATLRVTESGLWMLLVGEDGVFVPADAIDLLAPATWTIDRVVETDGLLVVGWRVSAGDDTTGTPVDSYFRIVDQAHRGQVTDAIHTIAPRAQNPAGTTESEA